MTKTITTTITISKELNEWIKLDAAKPNHNRSPKKHLEYILEQWRKQWEVKLVEPEEVETF